MEKQSTKCGTRTYIKKVAGEFYTAIVNYYPMMAYHLPLSGIGSTLSLRFHTERSTHLCASRAKSRSSPDATSVKSQVVESVDWEKQWYPIAVTDDLDPRLPHAARLLGKDLVLWRDGSGDWRCFQDACPHRMVPLSEGRIDAESGTLACSYHGWRFDSTGKCVENPQARFSGTEEVACSNKRAAAKTYPTQTAQGLVWVWGESGESAYVDSCVTPAPLVTEYEGRGVVQRVANLELYFVRDLPGSFDMWLENSCDQSHVPFAHHGVVFDRNTPEANHFKISDVEQTPGSGEEWRYKVEWYPNEKDLRIQEVGFVSPCLLRFYTPMHMGMFILAYFYVVPVDENTTRMISNSLVRVPKGSELLAQLITKVLDSPLKSMVHLRLLEVFDGDIVLVNKQNLNVKQAGGQHLQNYYLPNQADQSVIAWRKWWNAAGNAGPDYGHGHAFPWEDMPRSEILNRFNQHTKHCPSCRAALNAMEATQKLAKFAAVAQVWGIASQIGQGMDPSSHGILLLAIGTGLAVGFDMLLQNGKQSFIYTGYVHGER